MPLAKDLAESKEEEGIQPFKPLSGYKTIERDKRTSEIGGTFQKPVS